MTWDLSLDEAEELLQQHDIHVELVRKIGRGGQKCVFEAIDEGERVALKIISPGTRIDRIAREIRAMKDVDSEYVAKLGKLRQFTDEDETFAYFTETYVDGPSLESRIEDGECFDQSEALEMLHKTACGLDAIWSHKLVHRDIKPGNVMLRDGEVPVIVDFGIVRNLDMTSLTDSADPQGPCTVMYAPNEVLFNRKAEINCRADIFSLGVVGYEMVSGSHPFLNGRENVTDLGDLVPDLSKPFCRMIHRMMHEQSHRRYPNPARLRQRIEYLMGDS